MSGAFVLHRPADIDQAVRWLQEQPAMRVLGGGTELMPLTRSGLLPEVPWLALRALPLDGVTAQDGHLQLGAGATLAAVARSPVVRAQAPALAQSLLASASPQVRHLATVAGNLLQHPRCAYYRGGDPHCHRVRADAGCAVSTGDQRQAAIFGSDARCRAAHPSDLAVALVALDAEVLVIGPDGTRRLPLDALYPPASDHADRVHTLRNGELVTSVTLPLSDGARRSVYLKRRDRAAFQFALVSVAVVIELVDGRIARARIAAGGVGPRPWRLHASEAALIGRPATAATWQAAALAATDGATPLPGTTYKLELLQRCVTQALMQCADASQGDEA